MIVKGTCFVFGDHVNTDEIIPARYLSTSDPVVLARYCMEDIRPGFGGMAAVAGSVLVAGENFGCGSSREHAPIAIKAAGIQCVLAKSFARIFLRNCINIGLPIVELSQVEEIRESDYLEIDFESGTIVNHTAGKTYEIQPYPPFMTEIIRAGGWLHYAVARMGQEVA